ncbi:MAG TPA: hypothetical protein VGP36_19725, partial [Mycobacteriales bacterium]|nr:hypothetical protein [Mycobacteriales bacterium]
MLREAAAVARVGHLGIAHVVEAVVDEGVPWVVSVLPPGRSLGEVVRRDGPIEPAAAARIGLRVLDVLVAARVPHGDLTPEDIVLGEDDAVTVTGFAATPVDGTETPGYRAPEGGPGRSADLWSLGVSLHVVVEGRLPGGTPKRVGALRPVLDGLLQPNPARRADSVQARGLLTAAAGEPSAWPLPSIPLDLPAEPSAGRAAVELHDPEVAAALAAFEAALSNPAAPGRTTPVEPPFPPAAPGPVVRQNPGTNGRTTGTTPPAETKPAPSPAGRPAGATPRPVRPTNSPASAPTRAPANPAAKTPAVTTPTPPAKAPTQTPARPSANAPAASPPKAPVTKAAAAKSPPAAAPSATEKTPAPPQGAAVKSTQNAAGAAAKTSAAKITAKSPPASGARTEPAGTAPAGTAPAGTAPAGTASAGTGPAGTAPTDTGPAGTAPTDTAPTGAAPTGAAPGDTAPTDTAPPGAAPGDTAPTDTAPTGAAPAG